MSETNDREKKKWTLMFYFASDNALGTVIISQLKAIKQAGYHPDTYVVTQYDPRSSGTPTHFFDVNLINKLKDPEQPNIGFGGDDPVVRSLIEDKLWNGEMGRQGKLIRQQFHDLLARETNKKGKPIEYNPPVPRSAGLGANGTEPPPKQSLEDFLTTCVEQYPAEHYALFILGHGMAVGNDGFLFDEHAAESSLKLKDLGGALRAFDTAVKGAGGNFDFVSFHSCSVSSVEVAYELQGTADYMLAAQSPAFVGSWPYQHILTRFFNSLTDGGEEGSVEKVVNDVFDYCYYNSADYLLAGYSFALCLCDLSRVGRLNESITQLSRALKAGLDDQMIEDLILLAHLKSQSYWQEIYSDLFDFCLCLSNACQHYEDSVKQTYKDSVEQMPEQMRAVKTACDGVMKAMRAKDGPIVRSEFAGPAYQYSRGLSVYFPWAKPTADSPLWFSVEQKEGVATRVEGGEYAKYDFARATDWDSFLRKYFDRTMRETRRDEEKKLIDKVGGDQRQEGSAQETDVAELMEDMASLVYNEEGRLSAESALPPAPAKTNPIDGTGSEIDTAPLKNFPRDTRSRAEKRKVAIKKTDKEVESKSPDYLSQRQSPTAH